jgi:phospholipid N-methyltransferase
MTPSWLGRDMVALANIQVGDDILEPSAGNGAIVKEILDHMPDNCYVVAIELNKKLFNELKQVSETWRFDPVCGDFLLNPLYMRAGYNRIVMNPPHRKCIAHIEKAASLLRHGGRLVALVHSVYLDEIKKILPDVIIRPLPSETFVIEGNYIEAAVIVIDKGDGE